MSPGIWLLTGKSFQAANQAVAKLIDHGILKEITGRKQDDCSWR
jgi:hypothetical protein